MAFNVPVPFHTQRLNKNVHITELKLKGTGSHDRIR